jgi:hypothetical protein
MFTINNEQKPFIKQILNSYLPTTGQRISGHLSAMHHTKNTALSHTGWIFPLTFGFLKQVITING